MPLQPLDQDAQVGDEYLPAEPGLSRRARDAFTVAWPSFLMAGVLEALVFAVVDPSSLHWFGGEAIDWSAQAIYTVSFFIFWLVLALTGALTRLLNEESD